MARDLFKRAELIKSSGAPVAPQTPPQPEEAARPRTAPGAMAKFMMDRSVVHKEADELKERLKDFEGARPVKLIDPQLIAPSEWANRAAESFDTQDFENLKSEIASSGGNVQPIKVRPKGKGAGNSWEIVYGHRRHRACMELGIPVLALIEDLTEQQLFVEMDRENRQRADLSPWEQGMMYSRALDRGLFPSNRKLAEALGVDLSQVGKALSLAKLPQEVIAAFSSPLDLQFRWSAPLKDALQKDPDGVLQRARAVAQLLPRISPPKVYAELIGEGSTAAVAAESQAAKEWKGGNGKVIASLKVDKKGRMVLAFERPISAKHREELEAFVAKVLK